jgi:SAM-dependent methyltransferase
MKRYKIKQDYLINTNPSHHNDISYTDGSQNEVYSFCKKLTDSNNLKSVLDLGCGSGYKLIKYFSELDTLGIETEPCYSFLNETYPDRKWLLSGDPSKSFPDVDISSELVICSDVIEHIIDPDSLLNFISSLDFKYLVISTPDREVLKRFNGYEDCEFGPPLNMAHVREWSFEELKSYLSEKFEVVSGHHCEIQTECMFFLCKRKEVRKKKIHISSCLFGKNLTVDKINLPEQLENDNYEITTSFYNDNNFPLRDNSLHPRLKGKIPKMLEWMNIDADYYVWIDYSIEINTNEFCKIIEELEDSDICLFKHRERSSLVEELEFMESETNTNNDYIISRYKNEPIREQVETYLKDSNFSDNKLFNMGFFVYSKNLVKNKDFNLMKDWFFHNTIHSIQDQISFPYLLNKHKVKYKIFNSGDVYDNFYTSFNWNKLVNRI